MIKIIKFKLIIKITSHSLIAENKKIKIIIYHMINLEFHEKAAMWWYIDKVNLVFSRPISFF